MKLKPEEVWDIPFIVKEDAIGRYWNKGALTRDRIQEVITRYEMGENIYIRYRGGIMTIHYFMNTYGYDAIERGLQHHYTLKILKTKCKK